MEKTERRQFIANLPSEARSIFTPGLAWLLAGLRTCRRGRSTSSEFLLTHLPGFRENQWYLGVRSCLPLRGSPGFAPDSLYTFPQGTSPANEPQDRVSSAPCQPKCCDFVTTKEFRRGDSPNRFLNDRLRVVATLSRRGMNSPIFQMRDAESQYALGHHVLAPHPRTWEQLGNKH
jgi:hypothetical protein